MNQQDTSQLISTSIQLQYLFLQKKNKPEHFHNDSNMKEKIIKKIFADSANF